jgi:2-polyprenyl-3-methyl-5-hydroxy-6-metoxy-1,4-benzoquinol methylase
VTDPVRRQYEAYPYPARDPRDEAKRLVVGSPSDAREIDHYLFAGRRDWSRPLRALVAGGGTGDGLVMLAQHLADRACPAELHYLDLSEAARRIAEARIAARGLHRLVTFHAGSLLDVAAIAPGPYDYIDCCGVLHHLDDPAAGLRALSAQLSPEGGMGLMVYGALGRTGVYDAQAMLRALAADAPGGWRLRAR